MKGMVSPDMQSHIVNEDTQNEKAMEGRA